MVSSEQAVFKTILYSDIFDFSLTRQEIFSYLMSPVSLDVKKVDNAIDSLITKKILTRHGPYISLFSKKKNSEKRMAFAPLYKEKLKLAEKASIILQRIPTVRLIGVSGSLAVGNIKKNDDIDLFIISEAKKMWMTRFMSIVLLSKNGLRRTRGENNEANKICLNMFISDDALAFPKDHQDLYTAHEIAQLRPLFSRLHTYKKFIDNNSWIRSYLPHVSYKTGYSETGSLPRHPFVYSQPVVQLVEFIQRLYMFPHKTTETVTNSMFAFHPRDYRNEILTEFHFRLQQNKLEI